MADTRHVKGLADLQSMLDTLPAKVERNILRGAMRAGAKVLAQEAVSQVSEGDGDLKASIRVSVSARRGQVMARVIAGSKKAFYAIWVETGTAAHSILPAKAKSMIFGGIFADKIDHPGARPKPFMRPALDAKATDAVVASGNYIKTRLTKQGLDTADVVVEAE